MRTRCSAPCAACHDRNAAPTGETIRFMGRRNCGAAMLSRVPQASITLDPVDARRPSFRDEVSSLQRGRAVVTTLPC